MTTPTRPVLGFIEATMCWTQAKSPLLGRRHAADGPAPRVGGPDLRAPVLQAERRIGDDDVELLRAGPSLVEELRVAQGVAADGSRTSSMSWRKRFIRAMAAVVRLTSWP